MRNCLVNEKRNIYDYNDEWMDCATLQRYSNCNKCRRIKRKNDSKKEILDLTNTIERLEINKMKVEL